MSELHFQPIKERGQEIINAILEVPEFASCGRKEVLPIRLACEEVVVNIISYAYPDDVSGYIDVDVEKTGNRIVICFRDGGRPFNPLEQESPDTNLSWDQREIGGLGIFLVVSKMDEVRYVYEDHQNVLTIEKEMNPQQ